jgi:putative toxin-antitoxin system antitoxin component (TIGR02293 family)
MAQKTAAIPTEWVASGRAKSGSKAPKATSEADLITKERGEVYRIDFKTAYTLEPLQMVDTIKAGMPARTLVNVAARMGISKERLFTTLGLPRATVDRKVRESKVLTPGESSRLLGIARLVGQVQTMVEQSGDPENFNAAQWVANWLEEPMPALQGRRPAEFMDTAEGQAIVANLVQRAQSGAYA